jgi:tetratricopeptide (TPR) repeat protein
MTVDNRGRLDEADDWYRQSLAIREELGDRPGMATDYHQLGNTAQARGRLDEADDWYRQSLAIDEELGDRPGMATDYHQLGNTAQARGRLDEADDWYHQSLAIKEELGDRPGMSRTYANLGLLAETRSQAQLALAWNIRSVTLFAQFPSPLTGTGPSALARLTRQLGLPALEQAWQQVTGQPVPQPVRDYITSHHDEQPGDGS